MDLTLVERTMVVVKQKCQFIVHNSVIAACRWLETVRLCHWNALITLKNLPPPGV
ncbi:unnamed protein product [Staurois parvus]|uniref:Uncharacterized protein n=1 Tax=Staurois parvus TaxID=386267 RepID=A0ABN9HEU8_9NEOB|nr:unnamed protein product [Staurois parvus]